MSRALALPDDGRVVTVCCGGHHAASDCTCCAECVTNLDTQRHTAAERAAFARTAREQATRWRVAVEACRRWAYRTAAREYLDDQVHPLDEATRHAVAMPPTPIRPVLPELDALNFSAFDPLVLSRWFTEVEVPA